MIGLICHCCELTATQNIKNVKGFRSQLSSLHVLYEPTDEYEVSTDLWDIVIPSLSLLLLQFDGDTSDRTPLNALHQMGHITAEKQHFCFKESH